MPIEPAIQQLVDAFNAQGFVRLEATEASMKWSREAEEEADKIVKGKSPRDGWYEGLTLCKQMPQHEQLEKLLSALLVNGPRVPQAAQLSTLVYGFDRAASHHRHVDGYYAPKEGAPKQLAWHALLIGIPIVPLPECGDAGNPVVWPGSHRLTRRAFESLPQPSTSDEVGMQIESVPGLSVAMQPMRLHGPAGTIFVIDHDLHHGMLPHQTPELKRHIAYYRIPEKASDDPTHVVNRGYFFR